MSFIKFQGPKRREGQPIIEWIKETRLSTEEAYKAIVVLFLATLVVTLVAKALISAVLAV